MRGHFVAALVLALGTSLSLADEAIAADSIVDLLIANDINPDDLITDTDENLRLLQSDSSDSTDVPNYGNGAQSVDPSSYADMASVYVPGYPMFRMLSSDVIPTNRRLKRFEGSAPDGQTPSFIVTDILGTIAKKRGLRGEPSDKGIEGIADYDVFAKSASAVTDGLNVMVAAGTLPFKVLGRVIMPPLNAAKPLYQPIVDAVGLPFFGTEEAKNPRQLNEVQEGLVEIPDLQLYEEALASVTGKLSADKISSLSPDVLPNYHDAVDQVAALEEAALLRSLSAVEETSLPPEAKQDVMAELVGEAVKRVLRCNKGDEMRFNYPYYIGHPFYSEKRGYWENPMIPHPFTKADYPDMPPLNGPRYANRAAYLAAQSSARAN